VQDPPAPVKILGRYALYDAIASGGMATVHLGRLLGPVGFARTVAIKRLHEHLSSDPEFTAMFLEEARLAARIQHANVVATLDVVAQEGELFLVMEYVDGESLSRLLGGLRRSGATIPHPVLGTIVSHALSGLHAAHEARSESGEVLGLVHRDVSPENILVGRDGASRVLDFGVAKATERGRMTQAGTIKGKINYMAPEQVQGIKLDRRVDLYGMSVVLWEALTGQRLFEGGEVEVMYRVIQGALEPPSSRMPGLTPEIDALVMKGLSRDREARWSTAREMAAAVESVLGVASNTRIGELVDRVAGEALGRRSRLVEAVESASGLKDLGAHDTMPAELAALGRGSSPNLSGAARAAGTDVISMHPPRASGRGAMASRPELGPPPSFDLPDLDGAPPQPAPSPALPAPAGATASASAAAMSSLELGPSPGVADPAPRAASPALRPEHSAADRSGTPAGLDLDTGAPTSGPHAQPTELRAGPTSSAHGGPLTTSNPASPSGGASPGGGTSLGARAPQALAPLVGQTGAASRPSGGSGLVIAAVAAIVVLLGVGGALFLRSKPTGAAASGKPSASPPTAPIDVRESCELARKRFRAGGAATGIALDGWVFELWLRKPEGRLEAGHPQVLRAVSGTSITAEGDPELAALGGVVEHARFVGPLGGKPTDEGLLLRFSGALAQAAFEPSKSARLVALSDALFEATGADVGVLTGRCAHLRQNELALWIRAKDAPRAAGALLFTLSAFADVPLIPQQLLEPKAGAAPSSFDALLAHTKVAPKLLGEEIERDGGTISVDPSKGVRITFPAAEPARSGAASRRLVLDKRVLSR